MSVKCVFNLFLRREYKISIFDKNLRFQRSFCKKEDFGKMLNGVDGTTNNVQDGIFAQLTEMFGDIVPSEGILKVGREHNWNCK